jgi:hypothetical protein
MTLSTETRYAVRIIFADGHKEWSVGGGSVLEFDPERCVLEEDRDFVELRITHMWAGIRQRGQEGMYASIEVIPVVVTITTPD